MTHSARAPETLASTAVGSLPRGQGDPHLAYPGITAEEAFGEIARLADLLCQHLADHQWRTADRIRSLAENSHTTPGAS